ncbi:MAG: lysophospholipid acyltransferase family protein [Chloroflexota bacterium]|nr:1-acyl-sn-glycerol-3-phosphate acyltransferase [Chloroflexota bacterium]
MLKNNFIVEPEPPYLLPGGKIGLSDPSDYFHTLAGVALWLGLPYWYARLLGQMQAWDELYRFQVWWVRQVRQYLDVRLDIGGLKRVDPHQSYIVTPLHEGFGDILALAELPLKMRFVARDELFDQWKMLGPLLRDSGQLVVCPEQGAKSYRQLLRSAAPVFARGESLVIFPQGTILGIENDFSGGAFALAKTFKLPILPIALTGSHKVWEYPFSPRLRYGERISLRVLAPISVEECLARPREELRQMVQQRLKEVALSGTMAPPRRFVPSRDGYWDGYAYRIDPQFSELAADIERHRAALIV